MSSYKTIHDHQHHYGWDNSLEPVLHVSPGEEVEFEIIDSSGGQIDLQSTVAAVENIDFDRVNPVAGPIFVEGAEPGDALEVEILDFKESGWGWTAIIPCFGLLADDFPEPYLHLSTYRDGVIEFTPEIHLPLRAFPGTIGVALAESGLHSVVPPRYQGGNLDIRDLTRGSRLLLPVAVPGALLSAGDTHAAQGDGEVCGTAIESPMNMRVRINLRMKAGVVRPQFEVNEPLRSFEAKAGYYATTGIGPDLFQASQDAISDMIEHLGREYGLNPELAYCLCSVAVDLKISEIVDQPNWVVSAYLPKGIFR
jgi:formamidase